MKRLTLGVAVILAVSAMATVPARAQIGGSDQITIKGGIFNPAKGPAKDVGKNWWVLGGEYNLGNSNARQVNSIEGLYYQKGETITRTGFQGVPTRYKVLSLMFNRRYRGVDNRGVAIGDVVYYGAGLGLQYVKVKIEDPNPGGAGTVDKTRTVAAGNLFVGYELASNFEIEAKYMLPFSKVAGNDLSGFQFLIGVKF